VPRRFGLLLAIPGATAWRAQIEAMLDDPEMAAIVAGAPQMGRVLRPLCRMLGIKPVPALVLPRRPRPAPACLREAEAASLRRRQAAEPAEPQLVPGRRFVRWRGPGRLRLPVAGTGWGPPKLE
jgi:hypothetical protein